LLADDPASIAELEAAGLVRDPDVLDTWFSSALWPISVFGWPEETPELRQFYPTGLLSTAREIITLWVARMVVMGQFCRGDVPFRDVYIHAVILDGNGERMSKSKGNGVDPFDIVEKYGADALRFTLTHLATETQDVRMPVTKEKLPNGTEINASAKFELGRNFGTKVFNAAKLILANLDGYTAAPTRPEALAVEDRWMLHRTHETVVAVTQALAGYRFSEAARLLYDFVWGEVCDWYLELVKTRLRDAGDDKAVAQRIAATVLDAVLRLLHPIMPFVTEEVWQALKEIAPARGYPQPEAAAEACAIAPWPKPHADWRFPDAADRIAGLQQAVTAVRNLRSQFNVNPKEEIEVLVECPADLGEFLSANAAKALHLAKVKSWTCGPTVARPKGSAAQVLPRCRVYLPFGDLIDRPAEIAKQTKKLADLDKRLAGARAKLGNDAMMSRAPAEVVEQLRASETELLEQIAAVKAVIADLDA
jgi:valyl-tRNA synthetase